MTMHEDDGQIEQEIKDIERKIGELRTLVEQAEFKLAALRVKTVQRTGRF